VVRRTEHSQPSRYHGSAGPASIDSEGEGERSVERGSFEVGDSFLSALPTNPSDLWRVDLSLVVLGPRAVAFRGSPSPTEGLAPRSTPRPHTIRPLPRRRRGLKRAEWETRLAGGEAVAQKAVRAGRGRATLLSAKEHLRLGEHGEPLPGQQPSAKPTTGAGDGDSRRRTRAAHECRSLRG